MKVNVIGAGLAGSEATYQLAKQGIEVNLFEMRPKVSSPAHSTANFAELVCSNSLRSNEITNAVGLLKEELRTLDSLIMKVADQTALPSGSALAVDRESFSQIITNTIKALPQVTVINEEIKEIPQGPSIIATGPLTSNNLLESLKKETGQDNFYFFDAAAPIVTKESLNLEVIYEKSRYGYGNADYLNCPFSKLEFIKFYRELILGETTPIPSFEKEIYFEGCLPIEIMAKRGEQTLLFGPLKPVGLEMPNGKRPYGVVQLRKDNATGSLYNLVGFQTHLKFPEQKRIFRMIPGLEKANFVRYGVMHRNTYVNAPRILRPTYQTKIRDDLFIAGQFSGVEGYIESTASGMLAGLNMANLMNNKELLVLPKTTMIGAMANYITTANPLHFQPMNANWGIFQSINNDRHKDAENSLDTLKML